MKPSVGPFLLRYIVNGRRRAVGVPALMRKANRCWTGLCRTRLVGGTVVEWYNGSVNRLGNRERQRG